MSLLTISSCDELVLGPDPDDTPEINFQLFWEDYDKNYSRFELKSVNWDSLYSYYRPQINNNMSDNELFDIVSAMLATFRDAHAKLYTPFDRYIYERTGYSRNFDLNVIRSNYLDNPENNGVFTYGKINDTIGYLHVRTFDGNSDNYKYIDQLLNYFSDCDGIIIDIRGNGGGNDLNMAAVSTRFADQRRLAGYYRYKNGPEHDDFTDYISVYIEPKGEQQFTRPIALLTNREVASSAENFVLDLRALPHTTVIGDTTYGATGCNPIYRELPNCWIYWIPTAESYTPDFEIFEGIGLPPDIPVQITTADSINGIDTILEEAIRVLNNQ